VKDRKTERERERERERNGERERQMILIIRFVLEERHSNKERNI